MAKKLRSNKGFTVFLSFLIILCFLIPIFVAGYFEGKLSENNREIGVINEKVDTLSKKVDSAINTRESQRVFDSFSYWMLSFSQNEIDNMQNKISSLKWNLGCVGDSKDFQMDREHFEFKIANDKFFDISRNGDMKCFKNFKMIDCGVLC